MGGKRRVNFSRLEENLNLAAYPVLYNIGPDSRSDIKF